jgi:hypothetical protein
VIDRYLELDKLFWLFCSIILPMNGIQAVEVSAEVLVELDDGVEGSGRLLDLLEVMSPVIASRIIR